MHSILCGVNKAYRQDKARSRWYGCRLNKAYKRGKEKGNWGRRTWKE
jgi:hypothetical protein